MRLIEERELIRRISELPDLRTINTGTIGKIIKECRTIDAEPVRHGRWERMDEYCNHSKTFRCSVCKGDVEYPYFTRFCEYDYCPNCGAKMDEGEDNHGQA